VKHKVILDFRKFQIIISPKDSDADAQAGRKKKVEVAQLELDYAQKSHASETHENAPVTFDIRIISAAPFLRSCRKKGHVVGAIIIENIDKTLNPKKKADSAIVLPTKWLKFLETFSQIEANKLPVHRPYDITIELLESKQSPFGPLYGMSRDELLCCKKYLEDMLKKSFIQPSQSSAAAPVLFVKKLGEGLRFCVDYRQLNALTAKNRYSIPRLQETLNRLKYAKVFTKLDIIAAYNALRMGPGEEWKTVFRTRYGLYEYLVMPFGLANAPAVWQRFINNILREGFDVFCTAYLDDILIYSENQKDHDKHVEWVLEQLRKAGIQCDVEKCVFDVTSVKYLGLIISTEGISMDPAKIAAIVNWEQPTSAKEVSSFYGFANFYRRFIKGFSKIAGPLTDLIKYNAVFNWTDECEKVFVDLKRAFTEGPVLRHYDSEKEIQMKCDASDRKIGNILFQRSSNGEWQPVAYFFQKMNPAKCNYEIYDKKLLAVVRSLEEWRSECEGSKFPIEIISDYKNLEYFMSTKFLNRCQARWSEFFLRFNFKIIYRSGKFNTAADALSRRSGDRPKKGDDMWQQVLKEHNFTISAISINASNAGNSRASTSESFTYKAETTPEEPEAPITEPQDQQRISTPDADNPALMLEGIVDAARATAQPANDNPEEQDMEEQFTAACEQDVAYQEVQTALAEGQIRHIEGFPLAECQLINDQVYYRPDRDTTGNYTGGRRLVPKNDELRLRLISLAHDSPLAGHPGHAKCYEILCRNYY
jgi:hypothetical protein